MRRCADQQCHDGECEEQAAQTESLQQRSRAYHTAQVTELSVIHVPTAAMAIRMTAWLIAGGSGHVGDVEFQLVAVAAEFGGVHRGRLRRQCAEAAGDFGAHAVADAVFAAGQVADEERDAVVAQFHVRAELVAVVAALQGDRFAAGGFHVFEEDVLVVVFRFDDEFDFEEIAAFHCAEIGNLFAVEFFDALADDLAAAAGDVDRFVGWRELVVVAFDFQLEAGVADVVFEREVREVAVPVQRAGAAICGVRPCAGRG